MKKEIYISCASDVVPYLRKYQKARNEHFFLIGVNGQHYLKFIKTVAIGTVNSCFVYPREIFYHLIKKDCAAFIIGHNHPSGKLSPSDSDIETAKEIFLKAKFMGIPMLDSIIVSKNGYLSFMEHDLMKDFEDKEKSQNKSLKIAD